MKLNYSCPHCEKDVILDITPGTPAKLSGPPERCYPEEPAEFEPTECPVCGFEFDYDEVIELAEQKCREVQDYDDAAAEDYYDRMYDEGRGGN